jgi:XTP/dITP diphosphohydrolase
MTEILIASGNAHKVDEIRAVLAGLGIACRSLGDLGRSFPEPEEHADTFEGNARIKAIGYARLARSPCLADDSGLKVDALRGAPGVRSARYADDGASADLTRDERDGRNNRRLLRELEGVPDEARSARFVCALCLASPSGRVMAEVRGVFEGRIGTPPRVPAGAHGFGYDPLFLVAPGFERTSAELSADEKNARSHRGNALRLLAERLRSVRVEEA